MRIHVSPDNGVPIYMQIVSQLKYLVASGRLSPSDELPPIRALAEQLLINPNTVARAYRELEQAGILVSKRGSGTFVSDGGSPLARRERLRIVSERVDALLAEAHQLGIDTDELIQVIRKRDANMKPGPEERNSHD